MDQLSKKNINDENGTTNCWACTLAGLAQITVTDLKQKLGTMEIIGDDSRDLETFYSYAKQLRLSMRREVNCDPVMVAYNLGNSFDQNEGKFALLMSRQNAPGHIMAGYKINGKLYYVDYQSGSQLIPIDLHALGKWQAEYIQCRIIQFDEIDLFSLAFSSLKLYSDTDGKENF